ncbi:MAG: FAD-dependent oxidoreductase [Gammaproteobacteria bacterium]|nr:FAD-dependent oxidoreductase [Gammaproteobacteria bacterium]
MEVKVAGAGLIGRLLGWRLTLQNHEVTVYERDRHDNPTSAAYVAASMLAAQSERPESNEIVWRLAQESLRIWPNWLQELRVPYGLDGSVVVAHPNDENLLRKFESSLRRHGVTAFRPLHKSQIQEIEPSLSHRFNRALYLEEEGWLDNRALLRALENRCGDIYYETQVDPFELEAELVVDCRGVGTNHPEIRAVRGEVVRLHAPAVELSRPVRLLHPKYSLYVAPRDREHYVIGATQLESDYEGGVTVRSALELLSAAYTIHEGFEEAEIVELGIGLRPAFPDNSPRVEWRGGVLSVNGLYRHGYLVAPAVVNAATEKVLCK